MGENNYLKIVYLVFFLALASVSCWATASSLRLLWPDFPAHLQSSVFKLSKDLIDSIHEEGIVAYTS